MSAGLQAICFPVTGTENSGPGMVQVQRIRSRPEPGPDSVCENL